jgi:enterochelin esterase-like enzyme
MTGPRQAPGDPGERRPSFERAPAGPAPAAGAIAAAVIVLAAVASGTVDGTNRTLVIMGFDPDRAQLITSMLIGAIAAGAATLATDRASISTGYGVAAVALMFGQTFVTETQNSLSATGVGGTFDPTGWLLTLLTLLIVGVIASWAGATLAAPLRQPLIDAGRAVALAAVSRRLDAGTLRAPLAVVVVAVLLAVSLPVFSDLLNFSPDSRMTRGGPAPVALIPADPASLPPATGSGPVASASPPPTQAPIAAPSGKPWLAWLPTGTGSVSVVNLPAPWKGSPNTANVGVYTPPGYDGSGSRRYPVLYSVPVGYADWDSGAHIAVTMDALIQSGQIPPSIAVFVETRSGPYPDSECANSFDGREWMDTFISKTVVGWVDANYRTMAMPAARAVMGLSQGGYCSAILALRHPDVFGTSIPISGYFAAGLGDPGSALPFGRNAAALSAASPTAVAPTLSAAQRAALYFVIVASPSQPFYGQQSASFEQLLTQYGYPHVVLNARVPHGWVQVRQQLPSALAAWAARLVAVGVF